MARSIFPAQFAQGMPPTQWLNFDSAATFEEGALLVFAADGELEECAADPTLVSAVSLTPAGRGPGFQMSDGVTQVTGRAYKCSVVLAEKTVIWSMRGVNGGTDPVTPAVTNIGESYGAIKTADGSWALDIAEVAVLVFTIVGVDIDNKIFYCKFNDAALA